MAISTRKLVLASSSPRRREILACMGFEFSIVSPELDESPIGNEEPAEHVVRLSRAKASSVARQFPDELVVGADTIVVLNNEILGKPFSPAEAVGMLGRLSGKTHTVYTGLALIADRAKIDKADYDVTRITFNDLEQEDILRYVESGEPLDKAGAYGIQGMGSFLVKRYEGEFDTVIGFPSKLFRRLLEEVDSWRNR